MIKAEDIRAQLIGDLRSAVQESEFALAHALRVVIAYYSEEEEEE